MSVQNSKLWKEKCYVGGKWVSAADGRVISPLDPATGVSLGKVPSLTCGEAVAAVTAASGAWNSWRSLTPLQRAEHMRKWVEAIRQNLDTLAGIMTLEAGKPVAESKAELLGGINFIEWFAEEGRRAYGEFIPSPLPGKKLLTMLQPVGVVLAITPWNFPAGMIMRKAAASFGAGCTIVVRPPSQTPFTALALAELADQAGIPAGVFNVVTGNSSEIGEALATHPLVRKISFTGSTEVGKTLMRQGADTVKKFSMELGGNAPFLVFDDVSPDFASEKAMGAKFKNAGQTCISANRFLVERSVRDAFVKSLAGRMEKLKVGNGLEEGVTVGPLINPAAVEFLEELLKDAVDRGARILTGGKRHALGGNFFEPTILVDVTPEMRIFNEEIFGPIVSVVTFETEEEAVQLANQTPFGLASYAFTRDLARAFRVSEALEYGMVGVNEVALATGEAPFGGIKGSGMGREGSLHGLRDFMEIKYVLIGEGA